MCWSLCWFLYIGNALRARAAFLDVLPPPVNGIVAQCSELTLIWDQPPPIHLHVQPDRAINITNLRDLGVQNQTFMTWIVDLPISKQNFSFAYNTLADPFTVFQSNGILRVGPGDSTSCLNGVPVTSSLAPQSSTSSTVASPASSSQPPSSTTSQSSSTSIAAQNSSPAPVAAIAGGIAAGVIVACTIMGAFFYILCWRRRRPLSAAAVGQSKLGPNDNAPDQGITPFVAEHATGRPTAMNFSSGGTAYSDSTLLPSIATNPDSGGSAVSPSHSKRHRGIPVSPPGSTDSAVSPNSVPTLSLFTSPERPDDPPPTYQV